MCQRSQRLSLSRRSIPEERQVIAAPVKPVKQNSHSKTIKGAKELSTRSCSLGQPLRAAMGSEQVWSLTLFLSLYVLLPKVIVPHRGKPLHLNIGSLYPPMGPRCRKEPCERLRLLQISLWLKHPLLLQL